MSLTRLNISDFRNLLSINLELNPSGFHIIYGANGSGKTSFLEAIYYLSLGRSFRSPVINRIITKTAKKLSLFAHVLSSSSQVIPIGIERELCGDAKIRIAGTDVRSIAELAHLTAVQLINSSSFNLLETPLFRRKFLDWGAFYLSSEFLPSWKRFERVLKQRNAGLRNQWLKRELAVWDTELIESAELLNQFRLNYVQNLFPILLQLVNELLTIKDLKIGYQAGWNEELTYAEALAQSMDKDRQSGYTQCGPHRADLKININGLPAKDILSRGQQKLFVCAMLLAQGILLYNHTNKKPIYLVDDLAAELDITSRSNLMSLLSRQEAQVFVTAIEPEMIEGLLANKPMKMFHVEHGNITET